MNFFRNLIFGSPSRARPANAVTPSPHEEQPPTNNDANVVAHAGQEPSSYIPTATHIHPIVQTDNLDGIVPAVNPVLSRDPQPIIPVEDEIQPVLSAANTARAQRITAVETTEVPHAANIPHTTGPGGVAANLNFHQVVYSVGEGNSNAHRTISTVAVRTSEDVPPAGGNAVGISEHDAPAGAADGKENASGNNEGHGDENEGVDLVEPRALYERINNQDLPTGEALDFLMRCVRPRSQRRSGPANPNSIFHRPRSARPISKKAPVPRSSLRRQSFQYHAPPAPASSNLYSLRFRDASLGSRSRPSSGVYGPPSSGNPSRPSTENFGRPSSENLGRPSDNFSRPSSVNYGRPALANPDRPSSMNYSRPSSGTVRRPASGNFARQSSTGFSRPSSVNLGRLSSFNSVTPFVNTPSGRSPYDRPPSRPLSLRTSQRFPSSSLYYRTSAGPSDPRYYKVKNPHHSDVPVLERKGKTFSGCRDLVDPAVEARVNELKEMHRARDEKLEQWRKRPRLRLVVPALPPNKRRRTTGSFSQHTDSEAFVDRNEAAKVSNVGVGNQNVANELPQRSGNDSRSSRAGGVTAPSQSRFPDAPPNRAPDGTPLLTTQRTVVIPKDFDKRPKLVAYGCGKPRASTSDAPAGTTGMVKVESGKRPLDDVEEDEPGLARVRKMPRVSFAPDCEENAKADYSGPGSSPSSDKIRELPAFGNHSLELGKAFNGPSLAEKSSHLNSSKNPMGFSSTPSERPQLFPRDLSEQRRVSFSKTPVEISNDSASRLAREIDQNDRNGGDFEESRQNKNADGKVSKNSTARGMYNDVGTGGWSSKGKSPPTGPSKSSGLPLTGNPALEGGRASNTSLYENLHPDGSTAGDDFKEISGLEASQAEATGKSGVVDAGGYNSTDASKFCGQPFKFSSSLGQPTSSGNPIFGASEASVPEAKALAVRETDSVLNPSENDGGDGMQTSGTPSSRLQRALHANNGSQLFVPRMHSSGDATAGNYRDRLVEAPVVISSDLIETHATGSKADNNLNGSVKQDADTNIGNLDPAEPHGHKSSSDFADNKDLPVGRGQKRTSPNSAGDDKFANPSGIQNNSEIIAIPPVSFGGLASSSGPQNLTSDGRGASAADTKPGSLSVGDGNTKNETHLESETVDVGNGDPMRSPTAPSQPERPATCDSVPPFSFGGAASAPVFNAATMSAHENADRTRTAFKFSPTADITTSAPAGGPFSGLSFMVQSSPGNLSNFVFGAASKAQPDTNRQVSPFGNGDFKSSSSSQFAFGNSSAAVSNTQSSGQDTTIFGAGSSGLPIFNTSAAGAAPLENSNASSGPSAFGNMGAPAYGAVTTSGPLFGGSSVPSFGAGTPTFGSSTSGPGPAISFGASAPAFGNSSSASGTAPSAFGSSTPTSEAPFGANAVSGASAPGFAGGSLFGATVPSFGSGPGISLSTPVFSSTAPAFGSSNVPPFGASGSFSGANAPGFGANVGISPAGPVFGGFGSSNVTNPGLPPSATASVAQSGPVQFNSGANARGSAFAIGSTQTNASTGRRRYIKVKRAAHR